MKFVSATIYCSWKNC